MVYRPSVPVTDVRTAPVAVLVASMVTPGRNAPDASVTAPLICPLACASAHAGVSKLVRITAAMIRAHFIGRLLFRSGPQALRPSSPLHAWWGKPSIGGQPAAVSVQNRSRHITGRVGQQKDRRSGHL